MKELDNPLVKRTLKKPAERLVNRIKAISEDKIDAEIEEL
jgi:hypothetical protein